MPRLVLDTNVWRELIDADAVERVRMASKQVGSPILVAPGVVYEMLRTPDRDLRRRQIRSVTLGAWTRLMTEVFSECEDVRAIVSKRRPYWLLPTPDLAAFHRLRADWAGGRGFWYRARQDPDREARFVSELGDGRLQEARRQARDQRERMSHLGYSSIDLKGWTGRPPESEPGWEGSDVDAWRIITAATWWDQLVTQPSIPHLDWLAPFLDVARVARERGSWNHLWWHEVEAQEAPREWLRWAVGWLQGLRRVTSGTPGDNQIAIYTYEADAFVTADKAFADIITKVRGDAPAPIAIAHLIRPGPGSVEAVLGLMQEA